MKSLTVSVFLIFIFSVSVFGRELRFCGDEMATTFGGVHQSGGAENSAEIDDLGRFAVDEHNKREVPCVLLFLPPFVFMFEMYELLNRVRDFCCVFVFLKNALLEFARVIKAQEQVVAGKLHHLTVEVVDAGKKKLYEAKVWVKPWMNFKELQEFKHAGDSPSFTTSDLGVKKG